MFKVIFKKWKILAILLIIISGTVLFLRPKIFPPPKYKSQSSVKVKKGELKKTLTISGEVDAAEKVTLRFQTSGRLNWVGVREGDYVRKYQTIASLDQEELKKKLRKELNDYLNERWDFEQTMRDDYRDKIITDTIKRIKEKAQFDLDNSILDVEIQHLTLEFANLWTPIEGIVTKVGTPFAGVNITPAQAEFEIVNPYSVYFSAFADETEVILLRQGLSGELILDAFPDKSFTGSIKNISFIPESGESGTVYQINFDFLENNSDFRYRIGMVGDLNFVTEQKNQVLFLPDRYITTENGKKYVYIKRDNQVVKTVITTGLETENAVEVISPLKENDLVYLPE